MSKYFSGRFSSLTPYVPGEQPRDMQYIKLNTNESPYPPAPAVAEAAAREAERLQLYSDPECLELRNLMAERYQVKPENVVFGNGSDEILDLAFQAFADEAHPLAFADITYGFYPVFAQKNRIPYTEIPLKNDFTIDPEDYRGFPGTIVLANPNAPTGINLPLSVLEPLIAENPERVVIVDEAYVDFGGESAIPMTKKYPNLLAVGTFSKSRSMAGGRLGFAIGNAALIADIETLRYSLNPYNVNRMTAAAGAAILKHDDYYMENCKKIMDTQAWTTQQLQMLGFQVLPSCTNFVFAGSDKLDGETLYRELKQRGILIRHFSLERIKNYNRITIGTPEQMETLIREIQKLLEVKV